MILGLLHYIAIVIIFIVFLGCLMSDRSAKKANSSFPSLLITIGIAFTFLGVALGLQMFNVNDPTQGLEQLINGIKTAFWGSFAGILGAIFLKVHSLYWLKEQANENKYEHQVRNFYQQHELLAKNSVQATEIARENNANLIQAIEKFGFRLDENNQKNTQHMLNSVVASLNGIEHIQRSTQSVIASEIQELKAEFVNFAEKQAEQNTEIFIQALETAIQRFNENLTDTLGQNFKELNQSVERLVLWQDRYAEQITQQTQHYQSIAEDIQCVQEQFHTLLQNTTQFSQLTEQLEHILDSIDHKNDEFQKRIESFYGGLDAKIVEIEQTRQVLDTGLQAIEAQMQATKKTSEHLFEDIQQYIQKAHEQSLTIQRHSSAEVEQLTQDMKIAFEDTQQQLQHGLSTIETKLAQTLNHSLMTLAQQLGSLSSKFAQDYEPITVNLKNIIDSLDQAVK